MSSDEELNNVLAISAMSTGTGGKGSFFLLLLADSL
jgi:hypothetical protein